MPKLSDSQAVLLATAAARSDLSVLPPPETLTLKGAALARTLGALIRHGLIAEATVERRARKSKWVVEEDDTRKPPAPGDHPRRSRRHRCRARHRRRVRDRDDPADAGDDAGDAEPGSRWRDRAASSRCCSRRSRVPTGRRSRT